MAPDTPAPSPGGGAPDDTTVTGTGAEPAPTADAPEVPPEVSATLTEAGLDACTVPSGHLNRKARRRLQRAMRRRRGLSSEHGEALLLEGAAHLPTSAVDLPADVLSALAKLRPKAGRAAVALRRPCGGLVALRRPCVCSVVCRDTSPTCKYTQAKFRGEAKPPRRFLGANGPRPFAPDGPPGRADESANPGVTT